VLARFLWLLSCYAWPTALTVGLVVATTTRQRLAVGLAYLLMLFAFAGWGLVRNPSLSALDVARFWAITNLPATVLLLAFLHRRIRAVGPLVLAFMVVAVTGSQVAVGVAGQSEATLRAVIEVGSVLGLGGVQIFWGLMLAGAALAGLVGWQVLKWLGRRHLARRSSDQTLTLEAMWLLFAVVQTVSFAFEGLAWMAAGVVAFAAWKLVTTVGFRLAGLGRAPVPTAVRSGGAGEGQTGAPALLLLRVFALGARSERLFDALGKRCAHRQHRHDRRPRPRHHRGRAARVPGFRGWPAVAPVRARRGRPGAALRRPCARPRPRRTPPGERVLLPRRHLATDH